MKQQVELAREAQLLMDRKDDTKRAYAAWVACQHAEEQQHHALRIALDSYKSAVGATAGDAIRLQSGTVIAPTYVGPDRRSAPFALDAASTVLPQFNGVRD